MEVIERPKLAQIFRRFYPRYRQSSDVTPEQRRAAWCIQACRTPALGEDQWVCERCDKVHIPDQLRIAASKSWEVYAQPPFAGPEPFLRYVSLYTHRIAISSGRLLECDDHSVTFKYKDYRHGGVNRSMRLGAEVFIGRFLPHVVPNGFRRIRSYGFLANATGRDALQKIQAAWLALLAARLAVLAQYAQALEPAEAEGRELGDWTPACPDCGGPLRYLPRRLERRRPDDTS